MIPLEKKNAVRCEDFKTISLISHASKVILWIVTKRIERKVKDFLGKDQSGFRRGRVAREAIGVMRCLDEWCIEYNQDLFVCFVDYEKAFDQVNWKKLTEILADLGVDWKDRRLVAALYMGQTAVVRVNNVGFQVMSRSWRMGKFSSKWQNSNT